jgi:hypothetical protein
MTSRNKGPSPGCCIHESAHDAMSRAVGLPATPSITQTACPKIHWQTIGKKTEAADLKLPTVRHNTLF